jgi:hypothetical protein
LKWNLAMFTTCPCLLLSWMLAIILMTFQGLFVKIFFDVKFRRRICLGQSCTIKSVVCTHIVQQVQLGRVGGSMAAAVVAAPVWEEEVTVGQTPTCISTEGANSRRITKGRS